MITTKITNIELFPNSGSISITKVRETVVDGSTFRSPPETRAFCKYNYNEGGDKIINLNYNNEIDSFTDTENFLQKNLV
jgi:hypothetical protein